jgi:hypothetical protein
LDNDGQIQSIRANYTDAGGVDPFVELARGRAFFRYEDLLRLADLVERMQIQEKKAPDV